MDLLRGTNGSVDGSNAQMTDFLAQFLPVAAVLIYRFWLERGRAGEGRGARRGTASEAARKSRQRLH